MAPSFCALLGFLLSPKYPQQTLARPPGLRLYRVCRGLAPALPTRLLWGALSGTCRLCRRPPPMLQGAPLVQGLAPESVSHLGGTLGDWPTI